MTRFTGTSMHATHKARQLLVRFLRAGTYVAVVATASGLVGARVVRAQARDAAMGIGERMLGLELGDGARELVLNGQHVRISTSVTPLPVHEVLDRVTDACRTDADRLGDDLVDLPGALARNASAARPGGHEGIGLLRDEQNGRGVVTCFATGEASSMSAVRSRLTRFTKSHDLADIGQLRYVAARARPEGGTLIVATWSEGRLALDAMFPQSGDAAGSDPVIAPRPAGARRLLSLHAAPAPYGMYVYGTGTSAPDALVAYDAVMQKQGFVRNEASAKAHDGAHAYHRGNVDVLVTTADAGDAATLSVVESASRQVSVEGGAK